MTVDGPGFHVEPDVLDAVARGMSEIVHDQDAMELRTLPAIPEVYGDPDAHAAMTSFCTAWSVGVDAICDRARWMGTSLTDVRFVSRPRDWPAS